MFVFFPPHLLSFLNLAWPNLAHHAVTHSHLKCCQVNSNIVILHHTTICTSQYIIDFLSIPLVAQTCSGQSSHEKPSQTEFEPNQTDTNGFNQFQFWFQKFWLKPNSSVSSLGKNGLNQTKPNFPNTRLDTSRTQSCCHCRRDRVYQRDGCAPWCQFGWSQPLRRRHFHLVVGMWSRSSLDGITCVL